jgi:hypothetical protein
MSCGKCPLISRWRSSTAIDTVWTIYLFPEKLSIARRSVSARGYESLRIEVVVERNEKSAKTPIASMSSDVAAFTCTARAFDEHADWGDALRPLPFHRR